MEFFKLLNSLDKTKKNMVITKVNGKDAGAKILISDNEIIYDSGGNFDRGKVISDNHCSKSGTFTSDGNMYYAEYLRETHKVVVCGAGHISMPIIKICKMLDLHVTVIDDRISFTNNAVKEGAHKVICNEFDLALREITGDKDTFFVIVTRGHKYDQLCLESIIDKENAYIGMIGSRVRVKKVMESLKDRGFDEEKLDKVYSPIGLSINAETPAEIAISIMAEIIDIKNKKSGYAAYTDELMQAVLNEEYKDMPKALITLISKKGSAPREVGTKMIVLKDGTLIGTIGGGCVESNIRQIAFNSMDNKQPRLEKVDMTGIYAEEDGMVCGGIIELFVEPINTGENHDRQ